MHVGAESEILDLVLGLALDAKAAKPVVNFRQGPGLRQYSSESDHRSIFFTVISDIAPSSKPAKSVSSRSSAMQISREIYQSATVLIRQHGDGAAFHAAMRADAMLEGGDLDGLAVWKRIIRAVDELLSREVDGALRYRVAAHTPNYPKSDAGIGFTGGAARLSRFPVSCMSVGFPLCSHE